MSRSVLDVMRGAASAFPVPAYEDVRGYFHEPAFGLTKREYFAGLAMQAIIGTSGAPALTGFQGAEPLIAATACNLADALLAELDK